MIKRKIKAIGWNYAFVPKDVFLSKKLSHADVRLYCYLIWRAGQKDTAWPKVETMADDLGMSCAAIKISLKNLLKNEWIRREREFGRSSTTYVYERQEDCRSANRLAHDQLTGYPTIGQQDSRLNESQRKESQEKGASPLDSDPIPCQTVYLESKKQKTFKCPYCNESQDVVLGNPRCISCTAEIEFYLVDGKNPKTSLKRFAPKTEMAYYLKAKTGSNHNPALRWVEFISEKEQLEWEKFEREWGKRMRSAIDWAADKNIPRNKIVTSILTAIQRHGVFEDKPTETQTQTAEGKSKHDQLRRQRELQNLYG